jgi:phosphoserine phosphatase
MQNVLTLIEGSRTPSLDEHVLSTLCAPLVAAGAIVGSPIWLEPGVACDVPFEGMEPILVERIIRQKLGDAAIDVAAQSAVGRRKKILVADMESTFITAELLDELAASLGIADRIAPITARSRRGEIEFAQSLRERVGLLTGQPVAVLETVTARIELMAGARPLVQTMRAEGAYTALVSGGFDCFAAIVAKACGFDEYHANRLGVANGRITGQVAEPILDRSGKADILRRLAANHGIPLESTAAIGDGANDIAMLQAAGLGVAFHGKPAVAAAAGYRLEHSDLTGLLYLQGYRSRDFKE